MFATHLHTTSKTYTDSETQALRDLYVSDSAGQLLVERVERLELSSTAWKAVVLPVEPYPQQPWSEGLDLNQRVPFRETDLQSAAFNLSATFRLQLQSCLSLNNFEAESVDQTDPLSMVCAQPHLTDDQSVVFVLG